MTLHHALAQHFVFVNLGAGGDADYQLPADLQRTITLLELDAGDVAARTSEAFAAKISLRSVVAGSAGPRLFRRRAFWGASSLLESRPEVVAAFGLAHLDRVVETQAVEAVTLPELLRQHQIETVDFLKTDLEGLDFEVIRSCADLLPRLLALQCELRFTPYFQDEPRFPEVAHYLHAHGFELMRLLPEYWKHHTPHRADHVDGQLIWADCVFLKRPDCLPAELLQAPALALAKLILLAGMLEHRSYAEWLFERYRPALAADWLPALRPIRRAFGSLARLTGAGPWLRRVLDRLRPPADSPGLAHIVRDLP